MTKIIVDSSTWTGRQYTDVSSVYWPPFGFIIWGYHWRNRRRGLTIGLWYNRNAREGDIAWRWHFEWMWDNRSNVTHKTH